mgnify:CR=1 FL=1
MSSAKGLSVAVASAGSPEMVIACLDGLAKAREQAPFPVDAYFARARSAEDVSAAFKDLAWAHLTLSDASVDIPHLRGIAMQEAGDGWIAVTEDIFRPHETWLASLAAATESGADVIGGAIGNLRRRPADHAAYLTDYGAYAPSRAPDIGTSTQTGSNVAYSPSIAGRVAEWCRDGAWEHIVHDRLLSEGARLDFAPSVQVDHNKSYDFKSLMRTRFEQGREYARDHMAENGSGGRWIRILATPIMPFLQTARLARTASGTGTGDFLRALPHSFLLYASWTAGETLGFLKKP